MGPANSTGHYYMLDWYLVQEGVVATFRLDDEYVIEYNPVF